MFTDLDAYLATQDMGEFTVMAGKREHRGDVPKQFKPLKKLRRKPKAQTVDPFETEEIT